MSIEKWSTIAIEKWSIYSLVLSHEIVSSKRWLAAYIISTELPIDIQRQRSALPQEFAMMLFLPGIHYLNVFFKTKRLRYLIIAAEALALTLFIHTYAAVFLGIAYICVAAFNIPVLLKPGIFTKAAIYMGGAGFIGALPMLIGLLLGKKFHESSIDFVSRNVLAENPVVWHEQIFKYSEANAALLIMLICIAAICFFVLLLILRKVDTERMKLYAALSVLSLFLYTQFRAFQLGFPSLTHFARTGNFLSVAAVAVYGCFLSLLDYIPVKKIISRSVQALLGMYILLLVFNVENVIVSNNNTALEYDQAVHNYNRIKEEYPALNWTIVSPVEQYSYCLGYGWHYNLWEFVANIIESPSDEFVFTTDYVFVFVEKVPLHTIKPVTKAESQKPFPSIIRRYDEYYKSLQKRRVIQAKAFVWLEQRIARYGDFDVYYEDDIFKVYRLVQDASNPVNLVKN